MSGPAFWYGRPGPISYLLLPVAGLYGAVTSIRHEAYRRGWLTVVPSPVPVIVVGNLTVGGTGKTPLVAWLVQRLERQGWRPGIVARGYGSQVGAGPQRVEAGGAPRDGGDEPLLLARRTGVPVYVGTDRPAAVAAAHCRGGCDIVISDDGLQHYRMQRSIEVAVIDSERQLGNRRLLPAGPLREGAQRLAEVDLIAVNGDPVEAVCRCPLAHSGSAFRLQPGEPRPVSEGGRPWPGGPAHAVAGIGHPQRFFRSLTELGIEAEPHPFADHHRFVASDLEFVEQRPIIMTEKDAVKCQDLPQSGQCWYVPVEVEPSRELEAGVDGILAKLNT